MNSKEQEIKELAAEAGLRVSINTPGDGTTYYKFYASPQEQYFGGDGLYVATGFREARAWIRGYLACYWVERERDGK